MNFKAINEFGSRRLRGIKQIEEGVIHRSRRPRWVTPSEICLILYILRKPNSLIANYIGRVVIELKGIHHELMILLNVIK